MSQSVVIRSLAFPPEAGQVISCWMRMTDYSCFETVWSRKYFGSLFECPNTTFQDRDEKRMMFSSATFWGLATWLATLEFVLTLVQREVTQCSTVLAGNITITIAIVLETFRNIGIWSTYVTVVLHCLAWHEALVPYCCGASANSGHRATCFGSDAVNSCWPNSFKAVSGAHVVIVHILNDVELIYRLPANLFPSVTWAHQLGVGPALQPACADCWWPRQTWPSSNFDPSHFSSSFGCRSKRFVGLFNLERSLHLMLYAVLK